MKKVIALIGLLFLHFESQAMIIGSSCLKRYIGKAQQNKLVLLYDKHAFDDNDSIKQGHIDDMHKLIHITSKNQKSVPFLLEINEAHKDPERLKNMIQSPGNTAIKIALNNNMKYGNINFIPFDNRKYCDFYMRDMLYQREEFAQAIKQNYKFSPDFYDITAENFVNHLDTRSDENNNIINSLPTNHTIKDQYNTFNKEKHKDSHQNISMLLKKYNVNPKHHLFHLVAQLNNTEITQLYLTLTEENCFAVDINLLQKILTLSDQHPLSIVNAGVYHSHNIEKQILSHFPGFEKDISSSMSLPDLKINNLSRIQYPTEVPDHFINKNMQAFITIDHDEARS